MPTQAAIRREPRNTGKGISTRTGFTVIDLMISLAVLAIITSLALPSYRSILEKRQVTSGAEQIGAFLSSAQFEAVKHNQFVAVKYQTTPDGWCLGMRASDSSTATCDCSSTVTDITANNACAVDGAFRIFDSSVLNYPGVLNSASVGGVDSTLVYDPVRGLTINAESAKIQLLSDESHYALDVEVAVTGRVKICSNKDANKDVPGYKECSS